MTGKIYKIYSFKQIIANFSIRKILMNENRKCAACKYLGTDNSTFIAAN